MWPFLSLSNVRGSERLATGGTFPDGQWTQRLETTPYKKKWRAPEVLLLTFWSALASSRAKSEHYKPATPDSKRHVCYLNFEVEAVAVFSVLSSVRGSSRGTTARTDVTSYGPQGREDSSAPSTTLGYRRRPQERDGKVPPLWRHVAPLTVYCCTSVIQNGRLRRTWLHVEHRTDFRCWSALFRASSVQ